MKPIVRALAGSLLITMLVAGPALAQYPIDQPTAGVTDSVVVPCGTTTVTGSNWEAGSTVSITFDGEEIATATVAADGTFSATVTIPCDTEPGTHVLGITGFNEAGNARTVTTTITVVAGAGGAGGPGTGGDVSDGLLVMGALFLVGVVAIVATSRRRARSTA